MSASTNFSGSNGSNKNIADNGDHNIAIDTPLKNISISVSSFLFPRTQTPTFPKALDLAKPKQFMQSGRPKQSTTRPTNYAWLNDPWNQRLKDENQAKASIKPK